MPEHIDRNHIRFLKYDGTASPEEFLDFASQCPHLEMLHVAGDFTAHLGASSRKLECKVKLESVRCVVIEVQPTPDFWALIPNVRIAEIRVHLSPDISTFVNCSPSLEELHVPVSTTSLDKTVLNMPRLRQLHLWDVQYAWHAARALLDQMARSRPSLSICICSDSWPCGHPWFRGSTSLS